MKRAFLASVAAGCFLALAGLSASAQSYDTPTAPSTSAPSSPSSTGDPNTTNSTATMPRTMNSDGTTPDAVAPDTTSTAPSTAPGAMSQTAPAPGQPQMAEACNASNAQVFFDSNSDTLNADSQQSVIQSAESLRTCRSAQIVVAGHTDARGSAGYNMRLSERRAQSVKDLLVSQGVQASLIRVEAMGEQGATGNLAQDRRVELSVMPISASMPEGFTSALILSWLDE